MFTKNAAHFCDRLHMRLPIIQAPMAGGIVTPNLIGEVAAHGGLGSLPLGYLSLNEAQQLIRKTAACTTKSFAVNIFIPSATESCSTMQTAKMLEFINPYRLALGLPTLCALPHGHEPDLGALVAMVLAEGIRVLSFTFGILDKAYIKKLQQNKVFIMGTATTVQEGLALEAAGCDAVIAQGYEAGGHRGGGFLKQHEQGFIGTIALVPQMVDALKIPVVASGGIMDGRGIAAALILGASAVQMGTAFLTCTESGASAMHQGSVLNSPAESTCMTAVFTGKSVRAFKNKLLHDLESYFKTGEIPPYPLQHYLTKDLRAKANQTHHFENCGLWCGQGTQLSRALPVASLMTALEKETKAALGQPCLLST